jgi:hypothetical protein
MARKHWSTVAFAGLVGLAGLSAACGDDEAIPPDAREIDAAIDAAVDAAIDAPPGPCGADLLLTGEYIDWDSTVASFDGVENTVWTVVGEPARTATGAPNGRVLLCIGGGATVQITMVQNQYVEGRFVADPDVFRPAGTTFSVRGLKTGTGAAQYAEFGVNTYDANAAQLMVFKIGAPIPLALSPATTPAQRSFVSDGDDDITWTEGDTGAMTLFPNRPVGAGTATLTSTSAFTGPTTLPLVAGTFTFAVIR